MSTPASIPEVSFRARAARGTLWTALRYAAEYSLRFGSNLVLTRLLFPEAFGLMTLISTLIVGLGMFSDIGLTTSVVQSPRGDDPRFLRTVWTLQVLRGVLLWAIASALAGVMASFYQQDELRWLIPISTLTAAIAGFNSVSLIRMQRHLELGRLAAIELIGQLTSLFVTIGWGLAAPSVWALVGGSLVGSLSRMVLSYALARGDPVGFAWERDSVRQLLQFGKWIFLSTVLFFLAGQADRLLFGKLFSVSTLGVYGIALALATLPSQLFWSVGNFVLLPAFSRQAGSPDAFAASYRQLQLPVLILAALPVAGLLACGPDLIELLYDSRYADAGWMLQLLALGVWFQIPQTLSANALLAVAEPRWMAIGNGMKLLGMLLLVPAGYALFDVPGAIAGLAAAEAFRWGSLTFAVGRRGLPWRADLGCSLLVVAASLAGWLSVDAVRAAGFGLLPRICVGVGVLLAVWLPASVLLLREELLGLWVRVSSRGRAAPVSSAR